MSDVYHEHLLERYKEPSAKGTLSHATHSHALVNSSCGDEVSVEFTVDANGVITDAAWSGNGCSLSQVAADVLCERVVEQKLPVSGLAQLSLKNIEEWLELPIVSPGRIKCLSLGLVAAQKAFFKEQEPEGTA